MKKRFSLNKENMFQVLVIIGAIGLLCGYILTFIGFPLIGINEGIKAILELPYEAVYLYAGNLSSLGAIVILGSFAYKSMFFSIEKKVTKNKLKIIKRAFWSLACILFVLIIVRICIILNKISLIIFLAQSIFVLFFIEIILLAVFLLFLTNRYTEHKIKEMKKEIIQCW